MTDGAEFAVPVKPYFYHPWLNIILSANAYAFFGLIIYSCIKRRVFSKRIADVLLILIFALISDLAKTRIFFYFIFSTPDRRDKEVVYLPTTVAACTLGVWVFYLHFMITYVEAMVTIRRCFNVFSRYRNTLSCMFACLCIFFALQAAFFFESLLHGAPEQVWWKLPITCNKAYQLDGISDLCKIATTATMLIAPVLSMFLFCSERAKQEKGVTMFVFITSSVTGVLALVYVAVFQGFVEPPPKLRIIFAVFMIVGFTIQDFRFPLLILLAIGVVPDIRGAVFSTVSGGFRKLFGIPEKKAPVTLTNDAYLELDLN